MDSYSEIVTAAVEAAKNAVVKIDCFKTEKGKSIPSGSGSGFIFSSDGYLFTNCHVIMQAEKIRVSLIDGRETDAEIMFVDFQNSQIAVGIFTDNLCICFPAIN